VVLYLLEEKRLSPLEVGELINRQAGLLGISDTSADMHDLLSREANDQRAAETVALFCYQAKKFLGTLAAALGGARHAHLHRRSRGACRVSAMAYLRGPGIPRTELDESHNANHAPVVSREGGPVTLRMMPTHANLIIAREHLVTRRAHDAGRSVT